MMWSGGKDSALALDRAVRAGIDVARLINFYDSASGRVRFHATRVEVLQAQAAAIGIELRAIATSWPEMDTALAVELSSLSREGFSGVVFGDIHLSDVRAWYEQRVRAAGLEHVEPIWGEAPADLLDEFVSTGGRAVVTCVDRQKLDASWLGRVTDETFAADIERAGVDPCGENGEFHTFAVAGPIFTAALPWKRGRQRSEGGFDQLDVALAT
jgi:diphthine-ammonia ligase